MQTLREACERVVKNCEVGLERIARVKGARRDEDGGSEMEQVRGIRALWFEEKAIARSVLASLDKGETDW